MIKLCYRCLDYVQRGFVEEVKCTQLKSRGGCWVDAGFTKCRTVTPESGVRRQVCGWQQKRWLRFRKDCQHIINESSNTFYFSDYLNRFTCFNAKKKCITFLLLSSAAALYFHSF